MVANLANVQRLQRQVHPFCLVCSASNPYGLAVKFELGQNGVLHGAFHPNAALEGYEGRLHGGMIASLLDGVMTNCLFAHDIAAKTGELQVRYREPVFTGPEISLCAWIKTRRPPLFILGAELWQEGRLRATASAKFMEHQTG